MSDVLWDENASLAFEQGQESVKEEGVWVVFYWPEGDEARTFVFASKRAADEFALIFATELWDAYWDEDGDWPPIPETWSEIYDEVLEHLGNAGDVLTVEHREIIE